LSLMRFLMIMLFFCFFLKENIINISE
jgi:hypothetical protein